MGRVPTRRVGREPRLVIRPAGGPRAAGVIEAAREQPRVDFDRLEQGKALGKGSSIVERDHIRDLPTGGLRGPAGGAA